MISNKILLTNIPVFNNFNLLNDGIQISPFIHFNLLWTPFSQKSQNSLAKTDSEYKLQTVGNDKMEPYHPLRASAGFGMSLLTQAFAVEFYYNAYLKKETDDVGTEFFIKFGID